MLVLLVGATKILAVKAGTTIDPARLTCRACWHGRERVIYPNRHVNLNLWQPDCYFPAKVSNMGNFILSLR
jgi:hypothetical protein